jgi:flagella basal body P-ring formation protein FlgA
MAYTETTTSGYGDRLSGAFKGIAAGFVMFLVGTILLFWNEGNFVKTQKTIEEAQGNAIHVDDVSNVDSSLNGKLIHATAFANTEDVLTDGLFGISEKAIAISRKVEYYQYEEKSHTESKDKMGGGKETITTYTYDKKWVSGPIESSAFKDPQYKASNFVLTKIEAKTERAKNVSFGGYKLPAFIISSISGDIPVEAKLNANELRQWETTISQKRRELGLQAAAKMVHVNASEVYFGNSASTPDIGDVRVTLTKIMPADISIIAKVVGSTFEQYIAANGKSFSKVSMGTVSAENMFAAAHSSNSTMTWILRFLGVFLVVGGLKSMFGILPALFKVIPMLGSVVGAGVGLVCGIVGVAWSLIIIAIAWLFYRPIIGIALLAAAAAGIWYLKNKSKNKSQPQETPAA